MQIRAEQTFLDGADRYEEGETYDVDPALAGYFVRNGWASTEDDAAVPQPQNVTLDIESGNHEQAAEVPGG